MRLLVKTLFIMALLLSFTSSTEASEELTDPLAGFQISKDEIKGSLNKLKAEGKISESDYKKALDQLGDMSDGQINAMKDTAIGMVRNDPDKAVEIVNAKKISPPDIEKQIKEISQPTVKP